MHALDRLQPVGLLVLRVVLGAVLIAHGETKVFGGMHAHMAMVGSIGLPPWMGYLSAGTEFIGGILLVVGLITRLVSIAVVIEMLVAIFKVHIPNGMIGTPEHPGYQLPLLVCAMAFTLLCLGASSFSVDWLFSHRTHH